MRRAYKRHSTVSWSIWAFALVGLAVLMAWQFEWLPVDQGVVDTTDTAQTDPPEQADVADHQPAAAADPEIFQSQAEPLDAGDPRSLAPAPPDISIAAGEAEKLAAGRGSGPPSSGRTPPWASDGGAAAVAAAERESSPTEEPRGGIVPAAGAQGEPATSGGPLEERLAVIDRQLSDGSLSEFLAAHKELSKMYWDQPELREAIRARLDRGAREIYFSPQPHFIPAYVVQPGDLLSTIAGRYNVPWEYLERLNRISARRLQPGQKLKVIKGPFSAVIDLSDRELTVHHHGYFVRSYPVGIGQDGRTPIGTFKVREKLVNPTYYGTDESTGRRFIIDKNAPNNPLGERWIDIGDGYGIHGTIEPDSIGGAESKGCIRLHNRDVEELYDFLGVGSEVVIQR